jgi:hypothetical protein
LSTTELQNVPKKILEGPKFFSSFGLRRLLFNFHTQILKLDQRRMCYLVFAPFGRRNVYFFDTHFLSFDSFFLRIFVDINSSKIDESIFVFHDPPTRTIVNFLPLAAGDEVALIPPISGG